MPMLDMFNNIKTQTNKHIHSTIFNVGYTICNFLSSIEISFKQSVLHKWWLLFIEQVYSKYQFKFIKNGKIIRVQYNSYYSYMPEDTFDFLIFSNGINNRLISNKDQHLYFCKNPIYIVNTPCHNKIWFSSTLHYYSLDQSIQSTPIEFNTPKYNYLLSENIFDNLFIEFFVNHHYNLNIQNDIYSIDILHMNFKIETFNRNQLISLQNILKK